MVPCPCREACEDGGGDGGGGKEETLEEPCPSQGEGDPCEGVYHVLGQENETMSVPMKNQPSLCNNSDPYLEGVHAQIQVVGVQARVPGALGTP